MREALTKLRDEEMSHLSVWGYGNVEERESHFSWGEFGRFLKSGSQLWGWEVIGLEWAQPLPPTHFRHRD